LVFVLELELEEKQMVDLSFFHLITFHQQNPKTNFLNYYQFALHLDHWAAGELILHLQLCFDLKYQHDLADDLHLKMYFDLSKQVIEYWYLGKYAPIKYFNRQSQMVNKSSLLFIFYRIEYLPECVIQFENQAQNTAIVTKKIIPRKPQQQ